VIVVTRDQHERMPALSVADRERTTWPQPDASNLSAIVDGSGVDQLQI